MTESGTVFASSIPEIYDSYLVPLIFEDFAQDLAARTIALLPEAVLETAAGRGVVTSAPALELASSRCYGEWVRRNVA